MAIRKHRPIPRPSRAINLSAATFALSAISFIAGTIAPWAYTKLTFSGISIAQPGDVRVLSGQMVGVTTTDATKLRVLFSTYLKVASIGKEPLILESASAPSFDFNGVRFRFIDADAALVEVAEGGKSNVELPISPKPHDAKFQFPLLIKSETQQVVALSLWYRAEALNPIDRFTLEDSISRFGDYVNDHRLTISLRLNGRAREYPLSAGPWVRYQEDRQRLSDEQLVIRSMQNAAKRIRDSAVREGDKESVSRANALLDSLASEFQAAASAPAK
jgi:hypothetical protein